MKPFSLSAVLKYRKQLENSAATKLAQAQLEMRCKQDEADELERRYSTFLTGLAAAQAGGMTIEDLLQYENHLTWLEEQKKKLAGELISATQKVLQKRRIVVDRSRDKKILEKLKMKQNSEWRRYLEKKEATQLDEIAVLSHAGKRQET
jgi:flagellar FliJ protein